MAFPPYFKACPRRSKPSNKGIYCFARYERIQVTRKCVKLPEQRLTGLTPVSCAQAAPAPPFWEVRGNQQKSAQAGCGVVSKRERSDLRQLAENQASRVDGGDDRQFADGCRPVSAR